MEGQVKDFQQTDSYRELFGIDGEPIEFEWIIPQDLLRRRSSRRSKKTCKINALNKENLKIGSSSCQCSMTSIGRREAIQKSVFQIPNKSRSGEDTGHSSALEAKRSATELSVKLLKETGIPQPRNDSKKLDTHGILKRKNDRGTMHFNADALNTALLFRTIHLGNQLSIFGAV